MHIHILGVAGTFMASLAVLANESGHTVTGQDKNIYPPMSTQLEALQIGLTEGYHVIPELNQADYIIIGNALSRGNPAVEYILDNDLIYISGAQWLAEQILPGRWVLAVSGTHGKTTTTSMLAWILEYANLKPGFLIGGIAENFSTSARLGDSPFFVIEADEYDTAFFDKRSKFLHYHPRTLVINNLEFDHADIFPDLDAIIQQFHYLLRTVPANGLVLAPEKEESIKQLLNKGLWTPLEALDKSQSDQDAWTAHALNADGSCFEVFFAEQLQGIVEWELIGQHNIANALSAIAAARHAGVPSKYAIEALEKFKNVKRRLEIKGVVNDITVYDDFAHHPTAIQTTLSGLRQKVGKQRILAILEPRSNTMKMGIHNALLAEALEEADAVYLYLPGDLSRHFSDPMDQMQDKARGYTEINRMTDDILKQARAGDHLLVMSNGGFGGIHGKLLEQLQEH